MVNKTATHIEKSTKKVLTNIKNYWLTKRIKRGEWNDMKKYAERIRQYESEKQRLMTTCKTCAEYEREIKKLAERLKI